MPLTSARFSPSIPLMEEESGPAPAGHENSVASLIIPSICMIREPPEIPDPDPYYCPECFHWARTGNGTLQFGGEK